MNQQTPKSLMQWNPLDPLCHVALAATIISEAVRSASAQHTENRRDTVAKDEQELETKIQAKGLNAPRLRPEDIDAAIVAEQYHVFPGTTLTVCCLTLRNGFCVTGESAAASPENMNEEIGREVARTNARSKIWPLEGYLLRERLSKGA